MDANEIFKSLRQTSPYRQEVDAVIEAMERVVTGLRRVLGPHAQDFDNVITGMKNSIRDQRVQRYNVPDIFCGNGPLALKLAEHAKIDQLLNGKHSRTTRGRIQEMLELFNYEPSDDASQVYDLQRLVTNATGLVDPNNESVNPVLVYEPTSLDDMKTGFYRSPDYYQPPTRNLILAGQIEESKVKFVFFCAHGVDTNLWLHHPQEDLWIASNFDCVLPGLLDALDRELHQAAEALYEATRSKDWAVEWIRVQDKIAETFHRSSVLSHKQGAFQRKTPDWKEIRFSEAGRTVLCSSMTGDYPQLSTIFFKGNENEVAFTERFEEMPATLQQRMVTALDRELDALLHVIQNKEQSLEHIAPSATPATPHKALS